ncbi:MAG: family peptidase [Cohnella sp.]|jgi:proteasome lid subunit RPN8/RPN11|nr:family peptidase [Cohnella sp.]
MSSSFGYAILPQDMERDLLAACRNRLPNETCGILFGRHSEHRVAAERFTVIRNASRHPTESFSFAPGDWTKAFYEAQNNQRTIVGYFHSHPGGSPLPSAKDTAGWLPWGTYWIVGLTGQDSQIAVHRHDPVHGWCPLKLVSSEELQK